MKAEYDKKLADKDALLKSSNSNMSQALEQMKAEYEKKMTMLNGEINKFRNNFLEKEKELNKTQNKLYQYEGKVEDLTAKLKQLEDKLSKTANLSEAEKNQILKEMQDLKTQLEYEKIKNDDLSKKITELENIIKTKDSKIGSLNTTIIELKKPFIFETAFKTPFPRYLVGSLSRSSKASLLPVDAPEGTIKLSITPLLVVTSTSTVGFPLESRTSRACILTILDIFILLIV